METIEITYQRAEKGRVAVALNTEIGASCADVATALRTALDELDQCIDSYIRKTLKKRKPKIAEIYEIKKELTFEQIASTQKKQPQKTAQHEKDRD